MRRLIECDGCQRPWRLGAWVPGDRLCTLCRNPELEPLATLGTSTDSTCPDCGLTVTEPWHVHVEHCGPIAPPTPDYRAAKAELHNANVRRRELEEAA